MVWIAGGAVAAFLLFLVLPFPAVVVLFLLTGTLFPFSESRFRVTLGVLAGVLFLLMLSDRLRLFLRGRLFGEPTPLGPPIALFGLLIAVSVAVAIAHGSTVEEWPLEAFPLACLLAAPILVRTLATGAIAKIALLYVSILVVQSGVALATFVGGGFSRLHTPSFSIHPGLGAMLGLAVLAFHERRSWRVAAGIAVPILVLQVVATLTRGYWLGFLAGGATILLSAHRLQERARFRALVAKLAIGFAVAVVLVFGAMAHWGLLESIDVVSRRAGTLTKLGVDPSTRVRITEWTLAAKHFSKTPIFGTGYGFGLEFFDPLTRVRTHRWWFIHNSYLFFLLKMGVLGLLSFSWILAVFFRRTLKALPSAEGVGRVLLVGFIASAVQLLVMAATNYTFFSADNTPYVAFLLGGGLAICRETES
jgi:O-antigen ligase